MVRSGPVESLRVVGSSRHPDPRFHQAREACYGHRHVAGRTSRLHLRPLDGPAHRHRRDLLADNGHLLAPRYAARGHVRPPRRRAAELSSRRFPAPEEDPAAHVVGQDDPRPGDRRDRGGRRRRQGLRDILRSEGVMGLASQERHPQLPKAEVKRLFRTLRKSGDADIRNKLIESHLGLVEYLARRFAGRGEPLDDLVQVATIGLVKAVDRFDPDREVEFSTYATPTIVGELKRHFRDKGWAVRVPRRLQELNLRLGSVVSQLSQDLQRSPTIGEIAAAAGASEDEVLEALDSSHAYSLISLDATQSEEGLSYHEQIGSDDEALEALEDRLSVGPLLRKIPPKERRMLHLRFFKGMTQSEIAQELGISQMHVSRLLAKTLAQLRAGLEDEGES